MDDRTFQQVPSALIAELESRRDMVAVKLAWASGLMIVARAAERR
jgi:hypothetical protein